MKIRFDYVKRINDNRNERAALAAVDSKCEFLRLPHYTFKEIMHSLSSKLPALVEFVFKMEDEIENLFRSLSCYEW